MKGNPIKRRLATLLRQTAGRHSLIRVGRYLLNAGRFDGGNDMRTNGELRLAREVIEQAREAEHNVQILDIGANLGLYTLEVLSASAGSTNLHILAIEASSATHELLVSNVQASDYSRAVTTQHCAVSDHCGVANFNVVGPGAGTSSLLPVVAADTTAEEVAVTTIDQLIIDHGLNSVDLIKVDTEGHDYAVLKGAANTLANQRVGVIQFEYNWRWIEQRAYLRDVFHLANSINYTIGKITPDGIEYFDRWSPQLETLVENNYALVRRDLTKKLSQTRCWSTC